MERVLNRQFVGDKPSALLKECLIKTGFVVPYSNPDDLIFDEMERSLALLGTGSESSDSDSESGVADLVPFYQETSGPSDYGRTSVQSGNVSFIPEGLSNYNIKLQKSVAVKESLPRDSVIKLYEFALNKIDVEDPDTLKNYAYSLFLQFPPQAGGSVRNGLVVISLYHALNGNVTLFDLTNLFEFKIVNTTKAQTIFLKTFPGYQPPEKQFNFCGFDISNRSKNLILYIIDSLKKQYKIVNNTIRAAIIYYICNISGEKINYKDLVSSCNVCDGTVRKYVEELKIDYPSILRQQVPNIYRT